MSTDHANTEHASTGHANTDAPDLDELLRFALHLADTADGIANAHFEAQDFVIETKPDLSEVTIADRGTEQAVIDAISARFPTHAILGEEFGVHAGTSDWEWIIDPIDGTSNFVRGVPIWATLIGLRHRGVLQVGVVSAPSLHRRWWATRGQGAFRDGVRLHVSKVADPAHAFASYSDGHWTDRPMRARLQTLLDGCARQRCFGDFWQHMMVAEGAIDLVVEPIVSLWDLAAVQIIVEEAGGTFTDISGAARPDGGSAVSTNTLLHPAVLAALHG